jgi:hypothetical protein
MKRFAFRFGHFLLLIAVEVILFSLLVLTICLMTMALSACSSNQVAQSPTVPKYQLQLTGSIDGNPFAGIGIGPDGSSHQMVVTSPISVNYFTVQSCHRSTQFLDIITTGWFNNNTSFQWTYDEAPTIEDSGDCLLRMCAFSKVVGSPPVACAVVDFESQKYTLPGTNICNGVNGPTWGTAFCHTMVGLIERFEFSAPVVVAPQETNPNPPGGTYWIPGQCQGQFVDDAHTVFQYSVPQDECTIVFMEVAKPHRRAKLTVIPYNQTNYPGGS